MHRFADGGFIAQLLVSYPADWGGDQGDTMIPITINSDGTRARDRVSGEGYQVDFCGGLVTWVGYVEGGSQVIFTDPNGRASWHFIGLISHQTAMRDGSAIALRENHAVSGSTFDVLRIDPPDGVPRCS